MKEELLQAVKTLSHYCQNMICEKCELSQFCYNGEISSWIGQLRWIENSKHKCSHFHDGECDKFARLAQHQKCQYNDETFCPSFERRVA